MDVTEIEAHLTALGGLLVLRPAPGDGSPEIAWGDLFFYYAPDGVLPPGQPFATVVTKDYPDEPVPWQVDGAAFRVNVHVGTGRFTDLIGAGPQEAVNDDPAARDVVQPHPTYGPYGWISVVDPGERTRRTVLAELTAAHAAAARRHDRRSQ